MKKYKILPPESLNPKSSPSWRKRGVLRLFYLTFCILHFSFILSAQNLVPNYSFEDTIQCVQHLNQFTGYVADWIGQGGGRGTLLF